MNNHLKTFLFLALLTGLLMMGGFVIGGQAGAIVAFGISLVMNFASYWFSDKIVLSMYNAQEINQSHYPKIDRIVRELSGNAGLPKPKVYLIAMPTPNAFATGRNPQNAAIAISKSLMDGLDLRELKGVIAHEMAHIKNRDILISSIAVTIATAISFLAQTFYYTGFIFGSRGREGNGAGNIIGLIAFAILSPIIATVLHLAISRSREYLADQTGAQIAHDSEGLAKALEKIHHIARQNPLKAQPKHEASAHLFIVNPFKGSSIANLFSTHPPMRERVKRLREMQV